MAGKNNLSRRQFLKIIGVSAAAAGGLALRRGFNLNGDLFPSGKTGLVRETHLLMGTVLNLTLAGSDAGLAKQTARAALGKMRQLVSVFNRFDPASQLSMLNTRGSLSQPDPALVSILEQAGSLSRASGGAFDVSVKPLMDAYQAAPDGKPAAGMIRQALEKIGYANIITSAEEISYRQPGMGVSLDGIAKGAVIDGAVEVLRANGFENVIVEAGGDLLAAGSHAPDLPWRIGLRSPRADSSLKMPTLAVRNMAVATSGDYLQPYTPDFGTHHILDPRRGKSSPELASVTVLAPTSLLADALATAVMVAGAQDGLQLIGRFAGCEALLVDKNLQMFSSPGMGKYLG